MHSIGRRLTHPFCSRPVLLPGTFLKGVRVPTFSYFFSSKTHFCSTYHFISGSNKTNTRNNIIVFLSAICKKKNKTIFDIYISLSLVSIIAIWKCCYQSKKVTILDTFIRMCSFGYNGGADSKNRINPEKFV